MPKWSNERVNIPNCPSILPPGLSQIELQSILLRAKLEEIQYKLANLSTEAQSVVQFDEALSKKNVYVYNQKGIRTDPTPIRARDALYQERKRVIDSIDAIYPALRVPGAFRISNTKLSRKFFIPSPDFIGQIIGPRGETLKQLESKHNVRISIRGQGSTPDTKGTGEVHIPRSPDEPLHALIEADTEEAIDGVIKELEEIVVRKPDEENELKKEQLRKLAMYNGVISQDVQIAKKETTVKSDSVNPPWYDETLKDVAEVDDEVEKIMNVLEKKNDEESEEKAKKMDRFKNYIINLKTSDISMILPERPPPGLD